MIGSKTTIFFIGITCITLLGATLVEKPFTDTFWQEADSLHMTFPLDATYAAHEVTYFKWESMLSENYQYQLILMRNGEVILDSIHAAPLSKLSLSDTIIYFEPIPTKNRLDLQDLLVPDSNYQWTLIATNGTKTYQQESTFEVLETPRLSGSPVRLIDSSVFHIDHSYHYIIPIEEHGNVLDLNLSIDLEKGIDFFNSAVNQRISIEMDLISPSGTKVNIMNFPFSDPAISHRRTFDDDAFLGTTNYTNYVSELSAWNEFYNNFEDAQITNERQRPDLRIHSLEALNKFQGEDAFGNWRLTWQVYDQFKNFFQVDPNSIHLDITIEEHPILLKIATWDSSSVSLNWQSENSYDGFLVQKYADGATTPTSMQMVGESNNHEDAFLALDTAYMYRVIGQKGDQQSLSNIIRVKSPLDTPRFSPQFQLIPLFSAGSSLPAQTKVVWENGIETGFITQDGNYRYEDVCTHLDRLRSFHEFDTSVWSLSPEPRLELDFPKTDTVLSNTQLESSGITFQWSDNYNYDSFILEIARLTDGNQTNLFSYWGQASFSNDELIKELSIPGKYKWSICIGDQTLPNSCLREESIFYVDQVLSSNTRNRLISMWPNPADYSITILNESQRINEIRIYTISGSLLYQNTFDQHEVKLDVNTFESGFYIIHIIAADKTEIRRLVKQ